jgi:hypothetical protein
MDLVGAVAKRLKLLGELVPLLLHTDELGLGRFQRRLGDTALGAHRGLAREKLGQRSLGFARRRLR